MIQIKLLEWSEVVIGTWWIADAYRIEEFDGGGFAARVSDPQSRAFRTIAYGVPFEAAKAACQADFNARILSALTHPAGETERGEAVAWRVEHGGGATFWNVEANARSNAVATGGTVTPLYAAIPAPSMEVSDEMVERAAKAYDDLEQTMGYGSEQLYACIRAALTSALKGGK